MKRSFSSLLIHSHRLSKTLPRLYVPTRQLTTTLPIMSDKKDILTAYKVSRLLGAQKMNTDGTGDHRYPWPAAGPTRPRC
jgi:hypothetical protein